MLKIFNKHSYILMVFVLFLLLFLVGLFAWIKIDTKTKRAELAVLQEQLYVLEAQNKDIERLLNDADENELFEHLARKRGYVYADEKVYYDITPGN